MDYKYRLSTGKRCERCKRLYSIAMRHFNCGRADFFSNPSAFYCYACQLAGRDAMSVQILKQRYAEIWKMATIEPLPPELI